MLRASFQSPYFRGLRAKLLLLVLVTLAPAIGLILLTAHQQQKAAHGFALSQAIRFSKVAQERQEAMIENTRHLLTTLGQLPALSSPNYNCSSVLKSMLESQSPRYVNLGILDPNGQAICSALPIAGPVDLSFRSYFHRAVGSRTFASGEFQIGRISGKPSINFALPIYDGEGRLKAVPYAALNLEWLKSLTSTIGLPEGANLKLYDSSAKVLVSFPESSNSQLGDTVLNSALAKKVFSQANGTMISSDSDGITRLYSYVHFKAGVSGGDYRLAVGVPIQEALIEANPILAKNILLLGGAVLLTLGLLWFGSDWLILRRLRRILAATRKIARGDFSVRVARGHASGEIEELAQEFDQMAEALKGRVKQIRETESELRKAKDDADAGNRAKGEFLAHMSHEIRTPMCAILGFSELLMAQEKLSYAGSNYLQTILRNAQNLLKIIDEILDLSKVDAGAWECDWAWFALLPELALLRDSFSQQAKQKGVDFEMRFEGRVPQVIHSDKLRLQQTLSNVIANAIKFTDSGRVEVLVRLGALDELRAKLEFLVTDTGKGLVPLEKDRIFRAFSQGDGARNRRYGGTGLGLVLAKKFAQLLGGDVELVASEPGQGSTFRVSIDPGPLKKLNLIEPAEPQSDWLKPTAISSSAERLDGLSILVAEDSRDNQLLLARFLARSGAEVEFADNGAEAVAKANRGEYDLLLMDIQMPIMDGVEATRLIKESGWPKPIVALSAHAMKGERELCLAAGFDAYETKPIDFVKLILTIKAVLAKPREGALGADGFSDRRA